MSATSPDSASAREVWRLHVNRATHLMNGTRDLQGSHVAPTEWETTRAQVHALIAIAAALGEPPVTDAPSCSCGKPFPEDGGREGVCECCSGCAS